MMTEGEREEELVIDGYEPHLAAQVAAAFLIREGGAMEKLKLVKLLYLAERESVRLRMRPIFFDENFSITHGPVGTNALNGIDGNTHPRIWRKYMSPPGEGHVVSVAEDLAAEDFDDLSDSDIDIIDDLSSRFRGLDAYAMRDWTHDPANVPEYDPAAKDRRIPITDQAIGRAIGLRDAEEYAEHVAELRGVERGRRS